MPIYMVVASENTREGLRTALSSSFAEGDWVPVNFGAWFVRSPLVTTAEVRDRLGIKVGGHSGVVLAAVPGRYTGVAEQSVVEALQVWQEDE